MEDLTVAVLLCALYRINHYLSLPSHWPSPPLSSRYFPQFIVPKIVFCDLGFAPRGSTLRFDVHPGRGSVISAVFGVVGLCCWGLVVVLGLKNCWMMMMKGGKGEEEEEEEEEEKSAFPLFPRLHVNDTDKGGPRAPPRNKMALYEQLSIPSQKFNPAAASPLPLPYNMGTLLPSASSSRCGSRERSLFSPFYMHQSPSHLADMVHSRSSNANNFMSTRTEHVRSLGYANHKSSNAVGSATECNWFRPHDFSSVKSSCEGKFNEEDDFRVPTFVHTDTAHSNQDMFVMETKRSTPLHANSPHKSSSATLNTSIRYPSSYDKPLEQTIADPKLRIYERNHIVHKSKEPVVIKERKEKSEFYLESREKLAVNCPKAFSDQDQTSVREFEKLHKRSTGICLVSNGAVNEPECLNGIQKAENVDALQVRNESCMKASSGSSRRSPNMADDCNRGSAEKASGSVERKDADRNDEVSETSMVDSVSDLEISPDDVVGVIGPKQFWKARRAIVNQQRVFAVQVFELHRLIKVQKLIAASPYLLLEETPYISGSPQKVPNKILPPESCGKPQLQTAKRKDGSQKLNLNKECHTENTHVPPLPSHDNELNKESRPLPMYRPYSENPPQPPPPPVPVAPESKPTAWCYPPANHWLVPVMSPSEGLIYKPYPGPGPGPGLPAAGFVAPVYGSCGPLNLPPVDGNFITHQQQNMAVLSGAPAIPPNYFPTPYGLPVANPNISASAVEQGSPIKGSRPTMQIEQRSRSSCNMGTPGSEALSGRFWKAPMSKDSELQGSTASSPFERAQAGGRDALLLFPTVSAHPSQSHGGERRTGVIKVVPHNARSATESAARIFRSIQKERQQYES